MRSIRLVSAAGQVAAHLHGEIERGRWTERMPGVGWLAAELGVNRKTVEAALRRLESEGLLVGQGPGRKRRIVRINGMTARPLRIALMDYDSIALTPGYVVELLHLLAEAGHTAFFAERCLLELGMKVSRIRNLVERTEADAWVVGSGSREILEWFAAQSFPTIAMFGRRRGLTIAAVGPDKVPAYQEVTRELIRLGHRRIVMLCRKLRRLPVAGTIEQAYLAELVAHGITPGPYHLPDWDETIEGFHARLESLFGLTPPTALIVDEAPLFTTALQFLASRGLRVPDDVSLVCTDADRNFSWCRPSVAHISWDSRPVVRRIVRWATNVSHGKQDLRQLLTPAKFVDGGTIGPAKRG